MISMKLAAAGVAATVAGGAYLGLPARMFSLSADPRPVSFVLPATDCPEGDIRLTVPNNFIFTDSDRRGGQSDGVTAKGVFDPSAASTLLPYSAATAAEFKVRGGGRTVFLQAMPYINPQGGSRTTEEAEARNLEGFARLYRKRLLPGEYPEIQGFTYFGTHDFGHSQDAYVRQTASGAIHLECDRPGSVPFPNCNVDVYPKCGLHIVYQFSSDLLPHWPELHRAVEETVTGWQRPAITQAAN
ncbi:MAG TPA: hypothetical protein VEH84_14385 [Alphaproteobacteria bacterium]|nr:hypothetical protein [Alphaproteobacteria bacterium]